MGRLFRHCVLVLLLALGGGLFYLHMADRTAGVQAQAQEEPPPEPQRIPVEAERVTQDAVIAEIEAVGTLRANESIVIQPEIAGLIEQIAFVEGDSVNQGALIVALDDDILQAELAQAKASLSLSQVNYERADALAKQQTGSQQARDEALARLQADRAALALAEARLEKATIEAPFNGVLGLKHISPGEYVGAGEQIVNLVDLDPIKVDFRVPEVFLSRVLIGQRISVEVDAFPGEVFEGQIYAIDPVIDANGRAVHLRARVPNADKRLQPGLFARVDVTVGEREDAILVDESALLPRQDGKFVYRVEDGRAVLTPVETGARRPGQVEITEGLEADAVVITAGLQRLSDGAEVEVLGSSRSAAVP